MIDLDAIVVRLAALTAERLRPMVTEAVNAAIAVKAEPRIYFAPEFAKLLGKTSDAIRIWLKRGGRETASCRCRPSVRSARAVWPACINPWPQLGHRSEQIAFSRRKPDFGQEKSRQLRRLR